MSPGQNDIYQAVESQSFEPPGQKKTFFSNNKYSWFKSNRHFRNDRGLVPNQSRNCSWDRTGRLLANFFPCPYQQSQKSLRKLTRPSSLLVLLGKGNNRSTTFSLLFVCFLLVIGKEKEKLPNAFIFLSETEKIFLGSLFV